LNFAINIGIFAHNSASPIIRQVMGDAKLLERLGAGNQSNRKKGIFAGGPSLNETANAVNQLGGSAKSLVSTPLELAANFEAALNRVNALSGGTLATSGKLDVIGAKARELGKSTEFTATQAADAFAVLTQAGFGYEQQLASIGTVLDIATVAQIDMEKAANLTANALGGFGLQAKEADRVGQLLVKASNASQISIVDLGESFKYAAPGAAKLGIQIEDVGTAVAILGKAGLKGSMGGTSLRAFLGRLSMVTSKDFQTDRQAMAIKSLGMDREGLQKAIDSGELKNIGLYMSNALKKSKLGKTQQIAAMQGLFQERGALGAMVLMQAASLPDDVEGSWGDIQAKVNDASVTLQGSAEIMRSGTKGAAKELSSALEELGLTAGQKLLPIITPLIHSATEAAVRFAAWADKHPKLIQGLGRILMVAAGLGTVLGPLLVTIGSVKTIMSLTTIASNTMGKGLETVGVKATSASKAMRMVNVAGGAIMAALAGAAITVQVFENKLVSLRAQSLSIGQNVANKEVEIASKLSDQELTDREALLLQQSEEERARVEAEQSRLDNEWGGAYSGILGVFGGGELNKADDSAAVMMEQQYSALRDERLRREEAKEAETLAKKQEAPTLAQTGAGKSQVLIDPESKIRIVLEEGKAPRIEALQEGDIPISVETGDSGG
jgi:TP901 family phage tail tape measure protein